MRRSVPAFTIALSVAAVIVVLAHPAFCKSRSREASRAADACKLEPFVRGRVGRVIDGRTFVLEDGRDVRLAAIEVAPMIGGIAKSGGQEYGRAGRTARQALADLTLGRAVVLKNASTTSDRYGRIVAFGFIAEDPTGDSLQQRLLAQGQARIAVRVEPQGCLSGLRLHEKAARSARLGVWADPHYSMQAAERPAEILARRGRFTVVAGKVVSVRESRGTIYVNFGRRWWESFSAVVFKRNARALLAAGIDPRKLTGRRVEVRGFIEQRGGPRIVVARPEQIAVAADR